jgi:hypothetical protein
MKTLLSLGCVSLVGLAMAASPAQAGVAVGVTVPVAPVYAPAPVYPAPYYGYYAQPAPYVAPPVMVQPGVVAAPGVVVYGRYGRPYYYHRRWWR